MPAPPAEASTIDVAARLEGVPSAFAAARDAVDTVLRDRGLRRTGPEQTAEALLRGAAASAALETGVHDLAALRAGAADPVALRCARLSARLLGLVPTWEQAPLQALARLHALAAAGAGDDDQVGRPWHAAGAGRLRGLAQAVAETSEAPGMVVAAVVHAEVATAAAFASDNAVVARAAERLVLVARGVDPAGVTVPEAGHALAPEPYAAALAAYAGGGADGTRAWLLYAADAFVRGAEASPLAGS